MRGRLPVHTALIAVYFPLFLYSRNIHRFPLTAALWPALVLLAAAFLAWLAFSALLKDREKAGILVSLNTLAFFTFGHAYDLMRPAFASGLPALLGLNKALLLAWSLLNAGLFAALFRRPRAIAAAAKGLTAASLVLVLFPIVHSIRFTLANERIHPVEKGPEVERLRERLGLAGTSDLPSPLPDIYHIVLDAYPREDVLRTAYGHDNRPFTDFLRRKGFQVGDSSFSNYAFTALSMASALNFNYLDSLIVDVDSSSENWKGLADLRNEALSAKFLKGLGYRYVVLPHGWETVPPTQADEVRVPENSPGGFVLNQFHNGLLAMTPIPNLARLFRPGMLDKNDQHRSRILYALKALEELPGEKGPKLVYCHILAPHAPIVLGPEGQPAEGHGETNILRREDPEAMKKGVVGEIRYLNRRMESIVSNILERTGGRAVIILQSDHGEAVMEYEVSPEFLRQRHGILLAVHLPPGADRGGFRASMSPVNLYRHVFNGVFGMRLPYLEDRVYSSRRASPWGLSEVTGLLD
jgi:hypothetical protein